MGVKQTLVCGTLHKKLLFRVLVVASCNFVDRMAPNPKHTIHEITEISRSNVILLQNRLKPAAHPLRDIVGLVSSFIASPFCRPSARQRCFHNCYAGK